MSAFLRTHTTMPVAQIEDGMAIAPDYVYVIAPDSYLRVRDRVCRLSKPGEPRGHRFPVDVLFTSLAEDQGERAICVVLSGTGHNGTQGLREVKGRGGCALVQDPHTAKFDGMPRSAIDADLADQVLAPDKMPAFLVNYVAHEYLATPSAIDGEKPEDAPTLDPILALLRARSEHDFRSYKRSTLSRRVHRRMGLTNSENLTEYLGLLRGSDKELAALARNMLISVTSFFRDPEPTRDLVAMTREGLRSKLRMALRQAIANHAEHGFGTRLVEGSASYELKEQARFEYRADGLRCEVTFPLKAGAPRPQGNGQMHP